MYFRITCDLTSWKKKKLILLYEISQIGDYMLDRIKLWLPKGAMQDYACMQEDQSVQIHNCSITNVELVIDVVYQIRICKKKKQTF